MCNQHSNDQGKFAKFGDGRDMGGWPTLSMIPEMRLPTLLVRLPVVRDDAPYAQIQRGMTALEQAQRLGGGAKPHALQAAIAACHMRARTAEQTDWERIVLLYDALLQINPSPIVALNRAVAVSMVHGPAAGLDALDAAATRAADSALAGYHLFPSVRGDLLMKMGRLSEARLNPTRHRHDEEPAGTGIAGEQVEAVGEGELFGIGLCGAPLFAVFEGWVPPDIHSPSFFA